MKRKYLKILKVNVDLWVCYDLYIKTIIFLLRHTFTPSVTKKIIVQNKIRKSFRAIFFSLSGVSSMCRQIKRLASCCRRRRRFFVLFVCFFPLLLILPALERKQTNKHFWKKGREKSKFIEIESFLTCTSPFMSYQKRCKWIGTTLSTTTYVAIKGQPYLLEGHKPDVGRPNSFGLSALITRKKTSCKLKCMRLEWARYVGFKVLWQEDYRLTMSRGTSFNKSNKTFSGACKTESEQKVLFLTAALQHFRDVKRIFV